MGSNLELPSLRSGLELTVYRSWQRPGIQRLSRRAGSASAREALSAARTGLHRVLAGANRNMLSQPGTVFRELPLFQLVLDVLVATCGALRGCDGRALQAERKIAGCRSGIERRLP